MTDYLMKLLGDASYEEIEIGGMKVNLYIDACRLGRSTIVKKLLKHHSQLFQDGTSFINDEENYLMFFREVRQQWIAMH